MHTYNFFDKLWSFWTLSGMSDQLDRMATKIVKWLAMMQSVELLAKDQVSDAVLDRDMHLKMKQSHPKNLREAMQTALELKVFQLASQ